MKLVVLLIVVFLSNGVVKTAAMVDNTGLPTAPAACEANATELRAELVGKKNEDGTVSIVDAQTRCVVVEQASHI